jgi:hypothetical protein
LSAISAFWVAVLLFRGDEGTRFAFGLALGAAFAHFGWALLHWDQVRASPSSLLDPTRGFCVLFVPLGVLLAAPRGAAGRRQAFLAPALSALPLALATARLGCVFAGCCRGDLPGLEWLPAAAEMVALGALHVITRRGGERHAPLLVLLGIGAIRLVVDPFRVPPPLGEPLVPATAIAGGLIALGLADSLAMRCVESRER